MSKLLHFLKENTWIDSCFPQPEPLTVSRNEPVQRYQGYSIGQRLTGEWFSSLDPDSWYETQAQVKRAIDGFLKGRAA